MGGRVDRHTPGPETPEGMYVLAAAIADASHCDGTRETPRGLVVGRQQRLHWGKEDTSQREKITSAIAASRLTSVVVVGVSLDARNQERARRKCLDKLLWELTEWEISTVWLESRTKSLNRHDLKLIDAGRSQGTLPSTLRIEIGLPSREPMLTGLTKELRRKSPLTWGDESFGISRAGGSGGIKKHVCPGIGGQGERLALKDRANP